MSRPQVTLILARAHNGIIGSEGKLPWHLPEDLKRFKALTMGTVMIMGRRTFESLPGLLPGRRHIVLTRDPQWQAAGAEVCLNIDQAFERAQAEPISVIGGAEIFELFLPFADRLEITEVNEDSAGDTRMEDPRNKGKWREIFRDEHGASGTRPGFAFVTLERLA